MLNNESTKTGAIDFTVHVLEQAKQNLFNDDYEAARIMVAVAKQALEDLQSEFDQHLRMEERLKQIFSQTIN